MRDETAARQPVISPDCRALMAATLAAAEQGQMPHGAPIYYNYLAVIARTDRLIAALGYRVAGTHREGVDK